MLLLNKLLNTFYLENMRSLPSLSTDLVRGADQYVN